MILGERKTNKCLIYRESESREKLSKKGRDVFYAAGFMVSRPLLKLDVMDMDNIKLEKWS